MGRLSFNTVKTGSIVIGVLMLVVSVYIIVTEAKFIQCDKCDVIGPYGMGHLHMENFQDFYNYRSISKVVVCIFSILYFSLLIYTKFLVIPMLLFIPLDFVTRLIFIIIHIMMLGFLHPLALEKNIIMFISMIFDILIWNCIFSYHQKLTEEHTGKSGNEMKPV